MDIRMNVGDPARVFRVYPTGSIGELVPWPTADPISVNSTVPSVASAVLGQDPHSVVVAPLAKGTALIQIHAANCTSYINVTVDAAVAVDHLQVAG